MLEIRNSINERALVGKDNAVVLVRKNDKISELNQLMVVIDDCNIKRLGSIFVGEYVGR